MPHPPFSPNNQGGGGGKAFVVNEAEVYTQIFLFPFTLTRSTMSIHFKQTAVDGRKLKFYLNLVELVCDEEH